MKAVVIVDMQKDFVLPDGKLYVPKAETLIENVREILQKARNNDVKRVFTQDWHEEKDPEFEIFPPHCIKDTKGAMILGELEPWEGHEIIQKNKLSAWEMPATKKIFEDVEEIVVCGVATEYCIKTFVLGALKEGKRVTLVVDAIAGVDEIINPETKEPIRKTKGSVAAALMEMATEGCKFCYTEDV